MQEPEHLWRVAAMTLWTLFFCVGLLPVETFYYLRDLGMVVTQHALVNSYHLINLSLAAYLSFFVYSRCLEQGLAKDDAHGKALQLGVVALIAFIPLPAHQVLEVSQMPVAFYRHLTLGMAAIKLLSWLYLYRLFLAYYVAGHDRVFVDVVSWFPSSHIRQTPSERDDEVYEAAAKPEESHETK